MQKQTILQWRGFSMKQEVKKYILFYKVKEKGKTTLSVIEQKWKGIEHGWKWKFKKTDLENEKNLIIITSMIRPILKYAKVVWSTALEEACVWIGMNTENFNQDDARIARS